MKRVDNYFCRWYILHFTVRNLQYLHILIMLKDYMKRFLILYLNVFIYSVFNFLIAHIIVIFIITVFQTKSSLKLISSKLQRFSLKAYLL